ncbi:hypothetical protein, partial [Bacteroides intestinalis]
EPYEGKLSCTVLRGEGGSNALDLPDDATFDEHNGMRVNGKNIEYSIFVNKAGKRTAVVCNMSNESATQVSVSCEGVGELRYATPETLEDRSFEGTIELAPLSAIIIMEQ